MTMTTPHPYPTHLPIQINPVGKGRVILHFGKAGAGIRQSVNHSLFESPCTHPPTGVMSDT